jgi:acyl carrier protein
MPDSGFLKGLEMEGVLKTVQDMLCQQFTLTESQVAADQNLASLGMDSLSKVEFMYLLEDRFSISLAEERGAIDTVSDIAQIVERALAAKG